VSVPCEMAPPFLYFYSLLRRIFISYFRGRQVYVDPL
jgi:hypothetical protein